MKKRKRRYTAGTGDASGYFEGAKAGCVYKMSSMESIEAVKPRAESLPDQFTPLEPTPPKEATRYSMRQIARKDYKPNFIHHKPTVKITRPQAWSIMRDLRAKNILAAGFRITEKVIDQVIEFGSVIQTDIVTLLKLK